MARDMIIVASFGTTVDSSRDKAIKVIEDTIAEAFPEMAVRRIFTSNHIRRILDSRGIHVDSLTEGLAKAAQEGYDRVYIQPTLMIPGIEYDLMKEDIAAAIQRPGEVILGEPLIVSETDIDALTAILADRYQLTNLAADEGVVFMGHGTGHANDCLYEEIWQKLNALAPGHVGLATVEGHIRAEEVMAFFHEHGVRRVTAAPLMLVAGNHARKDLAGDEPDAWKGKFQADGFEITFNLQGLGELQGVRTRFVQKLQRIFV
ncbi:MAG: sirohydrochlorin cobaltochelatase [Lachnospiraceae bacterium]|nr:sirohydrochlorin cobaltochelatase [Lachnospiraceae bacterium]